jgi:hypothetical protein
MDGRTCLAGTTRGRWRRWLEITLAPRFVGPRIRRVDLTHFERSLARSGGVTRFWRRSLFNEAVEWLTDHQYALSVHDGGDWATEGILFADLAQSLRFSFVPSNMDALNGLIRRPDSEWGELGKRIAICVSSFDLFWQRDSSNALSLIDIIIDASRDCLLDGRLIVCLLQMDDPELELPLRGCVSARWNGSERLKKNRTPESATQTLTLWTD